jgi:hypothetical protein
MNSSARSILFAALVCLAPGAAQAQQPAAPAASAPVDSVRPEIGAHVRTGIEHLRAGRFQEALAAVAAAETVPNRTPYENFVLDQLRGGAAAGAGDTATAVRSYESALASGRLPQGEAVGIAEGLVGSHYKLKDWDRTVAAARRYHELGGSNPQVRRVLANALVQKGDHAAAARELTRIIADEEAAGRKPGEDLLRLLAASQARANDSAALQPTMDKLLRLYPKPAYWRDRVGQLQRDPQFDNALIVDTYRLLVATKSLEEGREYVTHAELALRAQLPGEAKAALDAAAAAGKLPPDAAALRDKATKDAAADAKEFAANPKPAATAAANTLVANGIAQATTGRGEAGIGLVEQGLAKGGVTRPELARLRLGWLLAQEGRADQARQVFGSLKDTAGGVGELARLWLIQLDRPGP